MSKLKTIRIWGSIVIVAGLIAATGAFVGCSDDNNTPANPGGPGQQGVLIHIPVGAAGMGSEAYGTNPLTVQMGTVVTWVNDDTESHTATSDTGVWDSGTLTTGQTFSHTFSDTGTFPYHSEIDGAASMSGTIEVTSASPSPSPSPSVSPSPGPSPSPSASPSPSPSVSPTVI